MAQVLPEVYDFRQHDRLWRRVQPGLEPYPEADTSGGNQAQTSDAGMTLAQESRLPGAEQNPCCMGTEAAELLTVLEGYIADELAERRLYLALAQRAPVWARQTMRELAEDEGNHGPAAYDRPVPHYRPMPAAGGAAAGTGVRRGLVRAAAAAVSQ